MSIARTIARELVAAFGVLALVFLSFGHVPLAGAHGGVADARAQASTVVYCGGGPLDDGLGTHAPCHACRAALADLPPPPCDVVAAFARADRLVFVFEDDAAPRWNPVGRGYARAPPIVV